MKNKAVIFDFDGVIIDSMEVQKCSFAESYKNALGVDDVPHELIEEFFSYSGDSLKNIFFKMKLPREMVTLYVGAASKMENEIVVFSGIEECLSRLKSHGYKCALCTGKERKRAIRLLEKLRLEDFFDAIVCSDDVENPKPNAESIQIIMGLLGLSQEECIMIGDAKNDIICAKNAGIKSVAAIWGTNNKREILSENPTYVVEKVCDLYGTINKSFDAHKKEINRVILNFSSNKSCEIRIEKNLNNFNDCLKEHGVTGKKIVICDSNVKKHCGRILRDYIKDDELLWCSVTAGENSKNLKVVNKIYEFLYEKNVDRQSTIIAFGGGVIGDLAGFVASTYLRGIRLVHLPTTMLAQVDSSIGGKVGVNYNYAKNLIGCFYQPTLVYNNLEFLKTLSQEQIRTCLPEIIARSLIANRNLFDFIEDNFESIFALKSDSLHYVMSHAVEIKSKIVQADEFERLNIRVLLNFGHTFGHALESYNNFEIHHGYCVAFGIVFACFLSHEFGILDWYSVERIVSLLKKIKCLPKINVFNVDALYSYILKDKKSVNGKPIFIIPIEIGKVKIFSTDDKKLLYKILDMMNDFIGGL